MSLDTKQSRNLRMLPGRIRLEIFGLKGNPKMAALITQRFSLLHGMKKIDPSVLTGRLLLTFEENQVELALIFQLVCAIEAAELPHSANMKVAETQLEIAAASDNGRISSIELSPRVRPESYDSNSNNISTVPLPLALSMGSLAILTAKQLFFGKSALARSPVPFYMSGLISVVTGYPFLKRGVQQFSRERKWNSDLMLGTGALALAIVRENLVVLAGLSLLHYVNWKRNQMGLQEQRSSLLSPEIQRYSSKASKWGIIAAGAIWGMTRSPLRAMAVLLAANPRPATISSEYAWNQAELAAHEHQYPIPVNGSLAQLARTKTIILEDTSLIFSEKIDAIQYSASIEDDLDKVICLAASLMEKSSHPWKTEVWNKAKTTCRTLRTAFHVEEEANGMKGTINNSKIFIGTLSYLQQNGIESNPYILEEKRLRKQGYHVLFIAKQGNKTGQCLGLIMKQQSNTSEYGPVLKNLADKGFRICLLQDTLNIGQAAGVSYPFDRSWLALEEGEIIERIAALKQQGEDVLFVAANVQNRKNEYYKAVGVPCISLQQLNKIMEASAYAQKIDQTVDQHFQLTKRWNMVGSALAAWGVISAPVTNLIADALSLVFLSRSKSLNEPLSAPAAWPDPYQQEVAAASAEAFSWHTQSPEHVLSYFRVNDQQGLSPDQVAQARHQFGMNQLEGRKTTPFLVSYLGQFKEFTTLILLGTSLLAIFTGGLFDGIAMGVILLANAAIGTIQERKAERVVETLNQFQPPISHTLRDGHQIDVQAAELVPGDIVCLEAGDRIPADLRLIRSWNLQINEAALTGESLPIEKSELSLTEDCPLAERTNMLYMGTDVCRGKGVGIVVHTGMNTEMGHLVSLLKSEEKEVTPLQEKVTSISKTFVKGALIAGGLVFLTGLLRGVPISQMITTSITLAASAIPEGLPVTITIALSAGIFRMAKKNVLIRKLSALETLGRTTVICTDKTGTLTKNEMTVKAIATVDRFWTVTGNGYDPVGNIQQTSPDEVAAASTALLEKKTNLGSIDHPELQRLLQIGVLCNNSKLQQQDGRWSILGDPTEGALLTLAAKAELWQHNMPQWHRGMEVPFDSNTGKMSVLCKDSDSNHDCYVFSKGALETIIGHCGWYQVNGEVRVLTNEQKQLILRQNEQLAADALRVLGFAYRPINEAEDELGIDEKEMIYVGMAGMIDPPKPEVELNIREAFELGVKPVMITGDHPITAIAIARQLGIYDGTKKVLSGHELEKMTEAELFDVVEEVSIFARVTPGHKLRIVTAFQQRGHIVAMTGDGVNDTPAIKQANVGIAMGQTGTEVTKQTAEMVLKEDHFGSIVDGVKEGRTIIGNIRKALGCLLTGNLAEILVTSAAVMIGMPIPFVPIQILLMNLLTDALPATILAVNPGNKTKQTKRMDIIDKELYQKVVTRGVLLGIGSLGLFAASLAIGAPVAVAQSVAFATLVSGQLIQTFSWRQEGTQETVRDWTKDRFLIGALGISWLSLLTALYVPPVARFFHTAPLPLKYWIPILLVAGSISIFAKAVLSFIGKMSAATVTAPLNETALSAAAAF